jgi:cytochrome c oxidase subunit III
MAQVSMSADGEHRGASPVLFGTMLFLASELLLFGGLFAAYFALRAETDPWPPDGVELDVARMTISTVLLVLSSFTYHASARAADRGRLGLMRSWMWVTIGLGVGFSSIQLYDYTTLSFEVSSNAYGTMFYAMTGIHGLHVLAGIVLMAIMLDRVAHGAFRDGHTDGLHAAGYYWHFVDVVWIALFLVLFVLR